MIYWCSSTSSRSTQYQTSSMPFDVRESVFFFLFSPFFLLNEYQNVWPRCAAFLSRCQLDYCESSSRDILHFDFNEFTFAIKIGSVCISYSALSLHMSESIHRCPRNGMNVSTSPRCSPIHFVNGIIIWIKSAWVRAQHSVSDKIMAFIIPFSDKVTVHSVRQWSGVRERAVCVCGCVRSANIINMCSTTII